jgi:hypothetical protein
VGIRVIHKANVFESSNGNIWSGGHWVCSHIVGEIEERPMVLNSRQES